MDFTDKLLMNTMFNMKKTISEMNTDSKLDVVCLKQQMQSLFVKELLKSAFEITYYITRNSEKRRTKIKKYYTSFVNNCPISCGTKTLMLSPTAKEIFIDFLPKITESIFSEKTHLEIQDCLLQTKEKFLEKTQSDSSDSEVFQEILENVIHKTVGIMIQYFYQKYASKINNIL